MDRRSFVSAAALAAFAGSAAATQRGEGAVQPLPKRDRIYVAFLISESANVIDTAGPWEVFQDVMLHTPGHHHPFELYTVAPTKDPVRMSGGMIVQPKFDLASAPDPHVIVVPAQRGSDATRAWLQTAAAKTDVTMSVCTGAFQLARAGLLKNHVATTHHDFWDKFEAEFPSIELRRGLRFVDNGRIATAGGLTSGIDMALHVVTRYFGTDVAQATAEYMEYTSDAWRAPVGKS